MTVAICLVCGAQKLGAFNPCPQCLWQPMRDEDRVRSMLLSDHYHPAEQLAEWGQAVAGGTELALPDEVLRDALAQAAPLLGQLRGAFELPHAPAGSAASALQAELAPLLDELGSLPRARERYLHVLQHQRPLVDDALGRAVDVVGRLGSAADPSLTVWLVRALCQAFAPHLALAALEALAQGGGAEAAAARLTTLDPGEQRLAHAALGRLAEVLSADLPLLRATHQRLGAALGES